MKACRACTIVAISLIFPSAALAVDRKPSRPLLLTGAKVLSRDGDRLLKGQNIGIIDGRISQVAPESEVTPPQDAQHLKLDGLTVIPGLIDLHTHLLLHPYDEATWNRQVLNESLGLRTIRAVGAARVTVESGFTTIRDLGTEGAGYADIALRDAIAGGMIPGPRVFAVTRAIVATGCYGPAGFDPRWKMPVGAQVADGVAGVRRVVREQIAAGADWIKVYADYRRRRGDPSTPTFSQAELSAIVREASTAGLRVSAHASTDEAIRRAINAGVATIEHGSNASGEVLAMMRDRGVALCPTLAAAEAMARYGGWQPGQPDHPRIAGAKAMFARALRAKVTIACGSDVGVFSHGDSVREIELMTAYGMTPEESLRAATATAATVLGLENELGKIVPGFVADLIAVRGDPLADPSVLRNPVVVIKDGRIVIDRR